MTPIAIAELESQLQDPTRRAAAASALVNGIRGTQNLATLASALEILAVVTRDPKEEAQTLLELGRLRLRLQDPAQAVLALGRALYLAPGDASWLSGLADVSDPQTLREVLEDLKSDAPAAAQSLLEAQLVKLTP